MEVYATRNPRVSNIALTGPYGSGKSSIIKSFLKRYRNPVLQISLAAFLPEGSTGAAVSRQEIERSILQQMLYGASAHQLPFSRFKRIKSPGRWSVLLSLYTILGVTACWHLLRSRDDILDGKFFLPLSLRNWPNLLWFAIGASFVWLAVQRAYKANLDRILALGIDIDTPRLEILDVRVEDLGSVAGFPGTACFLFEEGLYTLTIDNLEFILDAEAARAVVLNSKPISVQISLLNKCQGVLSDGEVREILAALPMPFSDIRTGHHSPRIDKTDVNVELVKWLDKRNIISSWSETFFGDAIRVNLYRKDPTL